MTTAIATLPLGSPWPNWRWSRALTKGGYEYREPTARLVCAAAQLEADVGILACAAASEFRETRPIELLAGCHAILNDCHDAVPPLSLEARVTMLGLRRRWTFLAYPAEGYFGRQNGRWCSSWQPPTLRSVAAARAAIAGAGLELARGARRWVDCRVQDSGWQAATKLDHDAEQVVRSRYGEGWRWVGPVQGIDPYDLCLMGRRGVVLDQALAMIEQGRKDAAARSHR